MIQVRNILYNPAEKTGNIFIMKKQQKQRVADLIHVGIDFHWHSWEEAGRNFDAAEFKKRMEALDTRFVYITAKCANGWSYYPTEIGIQHPRLENDFLGQRITILKELGYTIIAYYCIGLEGAILQQHPEWEQLGWHEAPRDIPDDRDGRADLESPYFTTIALPQIREIVKRYQVDGVWLDIFHPDNGNINYSMHSRMAFEARMKRPLRLPEQDPDYLGTWRYFRERGSEIRKIIRDTIKGVSPKCLLAINYAYSWREPYHDLSDVDYLSADPCKPTVGNSFETGFFARYAAQSGIDSDIHTTSHTVWGDWDSKGLTFMQREAVISIANGSKYMLWDYHRPDGTVGDACGRKLREIEKFIHDRENTFREGEITGDIVVLSTIASYENQKPYIFRDKEVYAHEGRHIPSDDVTSTQGASYLLQYSGRSFILANEDNISRRIADAKLIILPKQSVVPRDTSELLEKFVRNGGSLILVGAMPESIAAWTGMKSEAPLPLNLSYFKLSGNNICNDESICCFGDFASVCDEIGGAEVVVNYYKPEYYDEIVKNGKKYYRGFNPAGKISTPGALKKNIGKGTVVLCGGNFFQGYLERPSIQLIGMMNHLLEQCNYLSRINIEPGLGLEVIERVSLDKHIIHIINLLESNNFPAMGSYLPPVKDVKISFSTDRKPEKIILVPDGTILNYSWRNRKIEFSIPVVEIHKAVEIHY